ncbi:MAG: hypothetical protein QM655_08570 [Nocardioidaceae bacterium]
MTDEHDQQPDPGEVGSIAEEAAKLMAALSGLSTGQQPLADAVRNVGEHVGHGPDCRYCPVCQLINVVRDARPEVKQGLTTAATALLQVAQALLETTPQPEARAERRDEPVEKIDLDEE